MGRTITIRNPKTGYVIPNDHKIFAAILPVTKSNFIWRDVESNEEILSYKTLNVRGGWLIRFLNISEGNAPCFLKKHLVHQMF